MISIFNRKKYLVDFLSNFCDIHNHILPGLDDGAKTITDSLTLIKGFEEFGVHDFIATPHIMHNYYNNTPDTIKDALDVVKKSLEKNKMNSIQITAGAEHMIDGNFEAILEKNEVMPLNKDHILVEMSYLQPPINFDQAIKSITNKWFFPVLAHPERYGFLHHRTRKYMEYKNDGIQFQMNLLSLSDYYGKEVRKIAHKLLEQKLIDFVGSDIHNINQLNNLKEITLTKKTAMFVKPVIEKTKETFWNRD